MSELFQTIAAVNKITSTSDHGFKLEFITPELTGEEASKIVDMKRGGEGWLLFSPSEIEEKDIPDAPPLDVEMGETKTPGARLRGVLFVQWETKTTKRLSFDEYYKRKMERIIDTEKAFLD